MMHPPFIEGAMGRLGLTDRHPSGTREHQYKPRCPSSRWSTGRAFVPVPVPVLLVDDEGPIRRLIARALEQEGYRVIEAGDGLDALKRMQDADPAIRLVITDIRMPGLDGYELAERLRSMPNAPPILFISGYGQDGVWLPGPLLPKPFELDALTAEVRRLLAVKPGGTSGERRRSAPA
jgi:CheY-like chemotaxis protein